MLIRVNSLIQSERLLSRVNERGEDNPSTDTHSWNYFMSRLILNIYRVSVSDFDQVGEYSPLGGGGGSRGWSGSDMQGLKKVKKVDWIPLRVGGLA